MLRRWVLPAIALIIAAASVASLICFTPVTRDGTSVRRAIILQTAEQDQTFEEWSWIEEHYPNLPGLWIRISLDHEPKELVV